MGAKSEIEWLRGPDGRQGATWNPVDGCDPVSPGCDRCYADVIATRFKGTKAYPNGFAVTLHPERLGFPFSWRRPRRVFVNSMGDLFHKDVPDDFVAQVFAVMALTPQHTYLILTKRHAVMRSLLNDSGFWCEVGRYARHLGYHWGEKAANHLGDGQNVYDVPAWETRRHLPNVWLGVSVEDQKRAELRIPDLLRTPAAVRWISAEPLLGPLDLRMVDWTPPAMEGFAGVHNPLTGEWWPATGNPAEEHANRWIEQPRIDWVVTGGESGTDARPAHPAWVRALRDQCQSAGVPFFFKQWGEHRPVPVVDDPQFAGGRAFDNPRGGRSAAVIMSPGRSGTMRNAVRRPMRPGDRTRGYVMLDTDTIAVRMGKTAAGRELDGCEHLDYPAAALIPA